MSILCTVGTSSFDTLVRHLDESVYCGLVHCQIGRGFYEPMNMRWDRWIQDIRSKYDEYELIITHAGAGTIYELLESGKRFIVVPNLDRPDTHQLEICKYLEEKNLANVAYGVAELLEMIKNPMPCESYEKPSFLGLNRIFNDYESWKNG